VSAPTTTPAPPPRPRPRRPPRPPWHFAALGAALAAVLAVILFVAVGTTTTTPSVEQQATQGDLQLGINAATGLLLSLTVFPSTSHQLAPNFELTDQHGQPVSMNEFRGKVVVFSANDDQCEDLCTLLANDIVIANHDLGKARPPRTWCGCRSTPTRSTRRCQR
jgi:cytochrome oxidase Cu insertion factor (SCO1/SenC/PrrC family)